MALYPPLPAFPSRCHPAKPICLRFLCCVLSSIFYNKLDICQIISTHYFDMNYIIPFFVG